MGQQKRVYLDAPGTTLKMVTLNEFLELLTFDGHLGPTMEQPTVKIAAIEVFESEAFIRENAKECQRRTAYALVDHLLRLGAIDFDVSKQVTLCGCMPGEYCPHVLETPPAAMRAMVSLKAICDVQEGA